MIRLTNQIVYVCAVLTNFQPALVPSTEEDNEVESYFKHFSDQSSYSDSDEFD